ncbi:MAG TPA: hypothetical protein VFO16_03095 [Pseudonocardiaceae bacterium]|nr:hypothetical protein [Pseudonocardiaceae bacterium]
MKPRSVVFLAPKQGNSEQEWEDCAAGSPGVPGRGGNPRYIVADGATEAYDSLRWVNQLASSFIGVDAPELTPESLRRWFAQMQELWNTEAPARASYIEERKFAQGSFATFLGCELVDLAGRRPAWRAAALGDTVLFHVRGGRLVAHFPALRAQDFGLNPDGVHTSPDRLDHMVGKLRFASGEIAAGDLLFLATDAFAQWMIRFIEADGLKLWQVLSRLDHPLSFERMINTQRDAGKMKDDDVTLLRVHLVTDNPAFIVTCLP